MHFLALVERERQWFELLVRLTCHHAHSPEHGVCQAIRLMLQERARGLRN
jgi:hypothetical protein